MAYITATHESGVTVGLEVINTTDTPLVSYKHGVYTLNIRRIVDRVAVHTEMALHKEEDGSHWLGWHRITVTCMRELQMVYDKAMIEIPEFLEVCVSHGIDDPEYFASELLTDASTIIEPIVMYNAVHRAMRT